MSNELRRCFWAVTMLGVVLVFGCNPSPPRDTSSNSAPIASECDRESQKSIAINPKGN